MPRRRDWLGILLLFAVACGPPATSIRPRTDPLGRPSAEVTRVSITVSDLASGIRFFMEGLEAPLVSTDTIEDAALGQLTGIPGARARVARFRVGDEHVILRAFIGTSGRPVRGDAKSSDLDFQHLALVVSDMPTAFERVRGLGARPVSEGGPQTIPASNPAAGGIQAFYFRDADGHPLELIWYPPGKGDPRWQAQGDALFLGIDHTAIAVSNTETSQAFYEALGLRVAGRSLNRGVEQERLSGVRGAVVRITGLRGDAGMGVEFLEYEEPEHEGTRRSRPLRPNDIGYYETSIAVDDLNATVARLEALGTQFVSTGVVRCGASCPEGERRAAVVRDPDGHAVRIVERR